MSHRPRQPISEAWFSRLTPSKVSWASLIVLTLIVSIGGLLGIRYTVLAQEQHLLSHGADHAKRIARNVLLYMQPQIEVNAEPAWIVDAFQQNLTRLCDLETYSVFLINEKTGRIAAHFKPELIGSRPNENFLNASPFELVGNQADGGQPIRAIRAVTRENLPVLVYFVPAITSDGLRTPWLVAVQADISDLNNHAKELAVQVSLILALVSFMTIGVGFWSMRQLGRIYERQIEAQLKQRNQELATARQEIVHKTSLAVLGQTASMLAHEMRTPLASIKLALSGILGHESFDERDHRRLNIAIHEVDRLNALLSDTLDYVRPIRLSARPQHLDALLDQALAALDALIAEHGIKLLRTRCPACPPIRLDPDQIQQVMLNLLTNAIEACPQSGEISIRLYRSDDNLVLDIINDSNDSVATHPETLERSFDAFYTTKPKGSGLGLTVVRRVIDEHRGTISLRTLEDGRVCATMTLPIKRQEPG